MSIHDPWDGVIEAPLDLLTAEGLALTVLITVTVVGVYVSKMMWRLYW